MNGNTVIKSKAGLVVRSGRGVGPIRDYANYVEAERVDIHIERDGRAQLAVCFCDGATCTADHPDAAELRELVSRAHWAGGARVIVHSKA